MAQKILLKSKLQKGKDGKSFRTFYTTMNIVVKGEEEKGKQKKSLTVKFRKEVNTYNLKRGIITGEFDAPFRYEVTEQNGKKIYPVVWVRKIDSYEEKVAQHSQDDFVTEEETELPF